MVACNDQCSWISDISFSIGTFDLRLFTVQLVSVDNLVRGNMHQRLMDTGNAGRWVLPRLQSVRHRLRYVEGTELLEQAENRNQRNRPLSLRCILQHCRWSESRGKSKHSHNQCVSMTYQLTELLYEFAVQAGLLEWDDTLEPLALLEHVWSNRRVYIIRSPGWLDRSEVCHIYCLRDNTGHRADRSYVAGLPSLHYRQCDSWLFSRRFRHVYGAHCRDQHQLVENRSIGD